MQNKTNLVSSFFALLYSTRSISDFYCATLGVATSVSTGKTSVAFVVVVVDALLNIFSVKDPN